MGLLTWVFRPLTVLMLLLSLGAAPLTDALTHGPGALAAEADHAAWQVAGHLHHDSTDHDHSTAIILISFETALLIVPTTARPSDLPSLSGAIRDGPRRPPRDGV